MSKASPTARELSSHSMSLATGSVHHGSGTTTDSGPVTWKAGPQNSPGCTRPLHMQCRSGHGAVLGRDPQLPCHEAEEPRVLLEDWGVDDAGVREQGLHSAP